MVNSIGLLEDGDLEPSSPGRPRFDNEDLGKYSNSESDPEGEGEDRDEADDDEEVGPTLRDWDDNPLDISISGPSRSGANLSGSGDPASRKRSSTLLRASSMESVTEPKRRKVIEDVMGALLGKFGPDESKMVKLGPAAWKTAKQVFHASVPLWSTKDCNAFMAKYLQLVPQQKKEFEADF